MRLATMLLCFAGPVQADLPQAPPLPQAPAVAQAPPIKSDVPVSATPVDSTPSPAPPSYAELSARALRDGKPLVVGVRCTPAVPSGYLSYQGDFEGESTGMIVGVPRNGRLERIADLPEWASVMDVRRAVDSRKEARAASPSPFRRPGELSAPPTAEGEIGRGPWPESLPFPEEMQRYTPARYTQEIAVTDGRDRISRVPRRNLELKWQVPGGMEGVHGWRSDLYRYVPAAPQVWVGNIAVWNGSNFQQNRGWRRAYRDGTFFADVLSNDKGEVFEVRYREKEGGRWFNHVAFRNKAARPRGYVAIRTNQCASCHDQAGTGGYGTGLVPGGDGVLSDPFTALE